MSAKGDGSNFRREVDYLLVRMTFPGECFEYHELGLTSGIAGNLSSEKVTKRDIFHVFHTFGDLAQISIKQAYGFVQFLRTEDCMRALEREQGTQIRDKKIR